MTSTRYVAEDECADCAAAEGNPCGFHEGVTYGVGFADYLWRLLIERVLPAHKAAVLLEAYQQIGDAQEFYGAGITSWPGFAALVADTRQRLTL